MFPGGFGVLRFNQSEAQVVVGIEAFRINLDGSLEKRDSLAGSLLFYESDPEVHATATHVSASRLLNRLFCIRADEMP